MIAGSTSIGAARMLWEQCERQLYSMAVSDSSRYQQIVVAVRALADEMRSAASIEQLLAMWPPAADVFSSVVGACGLPAETLPREQVAGAAFALREREMRAHAQRQAWRGRIDAARQFCVPWVLLDESGSLDSGLIDPYRCIEMHLTSGLAVISQVQPDSSHGMAMFVVSVVKLDPLTGDLLDDAPGIENWTEHARAEDFVSHRRAIRDWISSRLRDDTQ